jgi:hypothetical protein
MRKVHFVAFLICFIGVFMFYGHFHMEKFKREYLITNGIVYSVDGGGKGNFGPGINYRYSAKGISYKSSRRHGELPYSIGKNIIGKAFPIVYQKYWYGYESNILITPNDFANYGLPFPDSLNWVLPHIKKQ